MAERDSSFPPRHKTVAYVAASCAPGSKVSAEQAWLQAMSGKKGENRSCGY